MFCRLKLRGEVDRLKDRSRGSVRRVENKMFTRHGISIGFSYVLYNSNMFCECVLVYALIHVSLDTLSCSLVLCYDVKLYVKI